MENSNNNTVAYKQKMTPKLRRQLSECAIRYYHKTYKYKTVRERLQKKGFSEQYINEYLQHKYGYNNVDSDSSAAIPADQN